MTDQTSYTFRRNLFERQRTVSLTDQGLHWSDGRAEGTIAYPQVKEIQVYSVMGNEASPASWRCHVQPVHGKKISLTSLHFLGLGNFEDRHPAMLALCRELFQRAAQVNPSIRYVEGLPRTTWFISLFFLAALVGCVAFSIVVFALLLSQAKLSALPAIMFAGGLVGGAGICWAIWIWLKRNWPRTFDPQKQDPFAFQASGDS